MLGRAAERFIRTNWGSIQELAEELYATFSPNMPIEASQIVINQAAGDQSTPFIINRPGDATGPSFTVNRGGGTNNFGDIDIHGSEFGGITFELGGAGGGTNTYGLPPGGDSLDVGFFPTGGGINGFGDDEGGNNGGGGGGGGVDLAAFPWPSGEAGGVPLPQDNPIVLYGEVVSKTSGQTYEVNVWAKSPNGPRIGRIPVRFPMVDASEEIPATTPCPVIIFPGTSGSGRFIADAVSFVTVFVTEGL